MDVVDQERVLVWQPDEHFYLIGFYFSPLSGTLRSITLKHYGRLCPDKRTFGTDHSLVSNPATCTSDRDSMSCGRCNLLLRNSNQFRVIYGAPDCITSVFFRCPGVYWLEEYISRNAHCIAK